MDPHAKNQSSDTAAGVLVEFLEVAITSIVFLKQIYPTGAFERRRYSNLVVHRARHPQLRDYIHSTVSGLLSYIEKGLVDKVAVIFFSPDNTFLERFIFKLALTKTLDNKTIDPELESSLKLLLVKLPASEQFTKSLSKDCRWEITGYFRALPQTSTREEVQWIPSNAKQWHRLPLITPIKSVTSAVACVQLYLEHSDTSEANP